MDETLSVADAKTNTNLGRSGLHHRLGVTYPFSNPIFAEVGSN